MRRNHKMDRLLVNAGTAGGTIISIIPSLFVQDALYTGMLAMIGATVSFIVSLLLRWIWRRRK